MNTNKLNSDHSQPPEAPLRPLILCRHDRAGRISVGTLTLAAVISICAQEKPYTQPGTGQPPPPKAAPAAPQAAVTPSAPSKPSFEKLFTSKLPDAIAMGKFNLNTRLRFEFVDQDGVPAVTEPSYAPTVRTRFGFTSAPLYGFQGMIEGEDVRVIGPESNFNAAGANGVGYKPPVADPPTTELNQAWLSYAYTNLFTVKAGRQRMALDNHRFVGDVGWRQNMQTYDAISAEVKPAGGTSLFYGYIWDVHRVFGDVERLPAANRDFSSASHLLNASYSGWKYGRVTGYSYLLDLENAAGAANSSATYGAYFAGAGVVTERLTLGYRAEFAWQTDYADSPLDYETEYYNLELSGFIKPFAFGAGYEVLGSDNRQGFRTPLATLHAFNGWADMFLNTPGAGLRDAYAFGQVMLPWEVPLRVVYHKYDADTGGADFGQEVDVVATKKFGKNWLAMVKYAFYDGDDAAPPAIAPPNVDVHKLWLQLEFNY